MRYHWLINLLRFIIVALFWEILREIVIYAPSVEPEPVKKARNTNGVIINTQGVYDLTGDNQAINTSHIRMHAEQFANHQHIRPYRD